jgi:peroxiredoxin
MPLLNSGDAFPRLTMNVLGGETLTVPEAFAGDFATVLFYRGAWCPYCNAQLSAFQRAGQALTDAGIRVGALSVDDEATTAELAVKRGLTFHLGYGAVAALTGAFINPDRCTAFGCASEPGGWMLLGRERRRIAPGAPVQAMNQAIATNWQTAAAQT